MDYTQIAQIVFVISIILVVLSFLSWGAFVKFPGIMLFVATLGFMYAGLFFIRGL